MSASARRIAALEQSVRSMQTLLGAATARLGGDVELSTEELSTVTQPGYQLGIDATESGVRMRIYKPIPLIYVPEGETP